MFNSFSKVFLVFMLCLLFYSFTTQAAEINMLACPEGCSVLHIDQYLAKEVKEPDLNLNAKITGGYLYNLLEMGRNKALWKDTVFGTNDDTLSFGPSGGKHPFTLFITEPVTEKFKLLYGLFWIPTGHFFITLNPNLKKFSDLKGKKIGVGLTTQSDWGMNPTLDLEYGYGITKENSQLFYLGPAKLPEALFKGEIDATDAGLGTGYGFKDWLPSDIFRHLKKSEKPLYYISHDVGIADKINEKLNTAYFELDIPAGTLPKQTETVHTISDRDYKACHETFPEDLAYKFVMITAKMGPKMKLNVGIWQTWSPEIMVAGLSEENAHPGAVKAFKELGWWDLTKKFKPVVLPK